MGRYHKVYAIACFCRQCGEKSKVVDSRPLQDAIGLMRVRKCDKCGARWKTIELMYDEFMRDYKNGEFD